MKIKATTTNEELVEMYICGNNYAFDELLKRTQPTVFSYIMLLVGNQQLADDIFQETYLKAVVCLKEGHYTAMGKVEGWLMRIAHNAVIDWFRRRKAQHLSEFDPEDLCIDKSSVLYIDQEKVDYEEQTRRHQEVYHLLQFLPESQQEIVKLRIFQGYSFQEISEMTGVCMNTNLGRMRYALINLRRLAKKSEHAFGGCII